MEADEIPEEIGSGDDCSPARSPERPKRRQEKARRTRYDLTRQRPVDNRLEILKEESRREVRSGSPVLKNQRVIESEAELRQLLISARVVQRWREYVIKVRKIREQIEMEKEREVPLSSVDSFREKGDVALSSVDDLTGKKKHRTKERESAADLPSKPGKSDSKHKHKKHKHKEKEKPKEEPQAQQEEKKVEVPAKTQEPPASLSGRKSPRKSPRRSPRPPDCPQPSETQGEAARVRHKRERREEHGRSHKAEKGKEGAKERREEAPEGKRRGSEEVSVEGDKDSRRQEARGSNTPRREVFRARALAWTSSTAVVTGAPTPAKTPRKNTTPPIASPKPPRPARSPPKISQPTCPPISPAVAQAPLTGSNHMASPQSQSPQSQGPESPRTRPRGRSQPPRVAYLSKPRERDPPPNLAGRPPNRGRLHPQERRSAHSQNPEGKPCSAPGRKARSEGPSSPGHSPSPKSCNSSPAPLIPRVARLGEQRARAQREVISARRDPANNFRHGNPGGRQVGYNKYKHVPAQLRPMEPQRRHFVPASNWNMAHPD